MYPLAYKFNMEKSDFKRFTDLAVKLQDQSKKLIVKLTQLIKNFFVANPTKRTTRLRDALLRQVYDFYTEAQKPSKLSSEGQRDLVCCIHTMSCNIHMCVTLTVACNPSTTRGVD